MAQPFTGVSLAWQKKTAQVAEQFMRRDARGFHQGQGASSVAPVNRPDTFTQNGLCPQRKEGLRKGGRPYMFLSLDDDFRALEFTAQLGVVAIDLLNLPRLCIGLRSALA